MQDDRDQFAQLGGGGDEEAFRTLIMLQLELSALRALDSQASLAQEQQLLRHAASYQRDGPPGMYVCFVQLWCVVVAATLCTNNLHQSSWMWQAVLETFV